MSEAISSYFFIREYVILFLVAKFCLVILCNILYNFIYKKKKNNIKFTYIDWKYYNRFIRTYTNFEIDDKIYYIFVIIFEYLYRFRKYLL